MIQDVKLLVLLAASGTFLLGENHRFTAAEVVNLVFTSISSDNDGEHLAEQLRNIEPAERVDSHTVFYFRNVGLAQPALAELEKLEQKSASLPGPPQAPLSIQPVPSAADQAKLLQTASRFAQSYVQRLPNFLCDQLTRRYTNLTGNVEGGHPRFNQQLHISDRFKDSLRFVNGVEEGGALDQTQSRAHKVLAKKGFSLSQGEFGTVMVNIFGPQVHAEMSWHHWQDFAGRRAAVISYFVPLARSKYELLACCMLLPMGGQTQQRTTAPFGGLVYIDPDTGVILRLTVQALGLPAAFWIKETRTVIDYAEVKIGAGTYDLPAKALVFVASKVQGGSQLQKNLNDLTFTNYRKFEAESVLTYTHSKINYDAPAPK